MLSEERVKLMTQMAMFEKREGKKIQPAQKYRKKDYVSIHTIGGVMTGTLCYGFVFMAVMIGLFHTVFVNISMMNLLVCFFLGVLFYILFLFFHLKRVRRRARRNYDEGRKLLKQQKRDYLQLEEIYRKEEAQQRPGGWN